MLVLHAAHFDRLKMSFHGVMKLPLPSKVVEMEEVKHIVTKKQTPGCRPALPSDHVEY
jgi:hypothetical protein